MQTESKKIVNLFKKYGVDGFVNVKFLDSKTLEYSPLYDEISLDSSSNITTSVTVIKEHKKSVFKIDGYSLEKIEHAIKEILEVVNYAEYDKDIVLPNVTDSVEKDFSNQELESLTFDDLERECNKFINFKFKESVKIESFSIGVNFTKHIYINSLGSVKIQKDNGSHFYMEIFGENGLVRDNHYKYVSSRSKPEIKLSDIKKLEDELLFKIKNLILDFEPGIYDVTLDREVVIGFLGIILGNMQAESIREGMSLFSKNKIGDKVFSSSFTLINNPNLKNYTGNMLFDEEGVNAKKMILFENGILRSKFCNYKNALKEGVDFLGNSTISNIELVGKTSKDYLSGSRLLFTNLMAFHTVDAITGKFSLNGEGYLLENGKKKGYVKNISLSGDIISLFSNIKVIGNDFKKDGNFKVPSITFSNQKVI